jgi:hypothetical protein
MLTSPTIIANLQLLKTTMEMSEEVSSRGGDIAGDRRYAD